GPLVEVEVVGAERRKLVKQGLLPFLGSQGYDAALLVYSVDRLRAWYQSRGFYRVEIEAEERVSTEERIEVVIEIEPGVRYELTEIAFVGNETIPSETLRRLMLTAEKQWLSPGTGRLVDETLEEDLRNLRSYYALEGFRHAEVGPPQVSVSAAERQLTLEIPIDEGSRRRVDEIEFVGVETLSESAVAGRLPLVAGGPFHQSLVESAVNDIRAIYRDEGFENVLASAEVTWDESERVADVVFRVVEGPRTVVRRVLVRGQQATSTPMLHNLVDLEPGDPVSRSRLLEIQRRLYRLGVFSQVEVDLGQGELLGGERDVLVRVREGDRHRLSLGAGYDTEDGVRGLFGYSLGTLFGRAGSVNFDSLVSQRERLFRLIFSQPVIDDLDIPVTYSVFHSREEESTRSEAFSGDFVTEIQGAQIEASFPVGDLRVPVLLTYKRVDNNAPIVLEEILFDREKVDVAISSIGAALLLDRRDSQINPTRGRNTVLQLEYAVQAFGTDENFVKLFAQQTQYFRLGRFGILGASARLGGIESYRQPIEGIARRGGEEGVPFPCGPDLIPDFRVAVSERFFAGGRSTHRAYELDTLGILGETLFVNRREDPEGLCREVGLFPSGGNGLALLNLDYRYPLGDTFWATLFFDWGNVFADWREITTSELKRGVGAGIGWDSPIGPLRLEIGWKLDRERFEDPYQIFLSFGSAF
ncbi:MAG: BamA/TamA family outer membrane protein, partial [Thermoanaerobaculia bacterium]|nr:BamA/TamA family outer membrane protein [Thermoanaerobaculia bacterium]